MSDEIQLTPEDEEILERIERRRIEEAEKRERDTAARQKREAERNGAGKAKEPVQGEVA